MEWLLFEQNWVHYLWMKHTSGCIILRECATHPYVMYSTSKTIVQIPTVFFGDTASDEKGMPLLVHTLNRMYDTLPENSHGARNVTI